MPAARQTRQPRRRTATLLASLLLASSCAWGQAAPLRERLAEIREINRFTPERALPMLLAIEKEARAAPVEDAGEMLAQLCVAYQKVGKQELALATCDELIAFGRARRDNGALAKGLLRKGYIKYDQNELATSHELIWEAERLANTTNDVELRVRVGVSAAEAFAEDGNFPHALEKMQTTLVYTRQHGDPVYLVIALNSLARLYRQMREYDKGFEALAEAMVAAEKTRSPGRVATLKNTEYGLAVESGQMERALKAQMAALALERQNGAQSMVVD
jgi:tetratricopeptide (TPR) repeat protein